MKKFFIMTRGRTGSTAVMDSLNKSKSIVAAQELFIKYAVKNKKKNVHDQLIPRFDLWLDLKKGYLNVIKFFTGQSYILKKYLALAESKSLNSESKGFGFKIISHHFDERPKLKKLLLERNYIAIYLTRNIPRQVISGMVAKLRGKYNAHDRENYSDEASYTIDIDEFKSLVQWETQAVANDIAMLESSGFEFIQVRYEDFVQNPDAFFANIFDFIDIPAEILPASSFSIMIKDLEQVVQNYQEVEHCLAEMGMGIE
jgi:LPS sulfotransferase NodH